MVAIRRILTSKPGRESYAAQWAEPWPASDGRGRDALTGGGNGALALLGTRDDRGASLSGFMLWLVNFIRSPR